MNIQSLSLQCTFTVAGQKRGYEDSYHSSGSGGYDRRSSRDNDYHYDRESKRGTYDKSQSCKILTVKAFIIQHIFINTHLSHFRR